MKYGKQTVFVITINGTHSWDVLADTRDQLNDMIIAAGLEATIDGELGIIVSKLEDATADDVVAVLNGIDEAKSEVLQ
jgi:hypothetical protein